MLYQRYFLRMNQSNTTHILALLLTLILALSCTHLVFTTLQLRRNLDMTTTTTTMTPPAAVERLLLLAENGTAGNVSLASMTPSTTSTTMATLAMLQPQQMGHQLVAANAPGSRLLLAQRVKRKHYRRQHSKQRYKQQQQHQRQLQHHHQLHRHRVR